MNPLPLTCEASYLADFLSEADADALFAELLSGFDVTNRRIRMFDGTEHIGKTGIYTFTDAELTSFDVFPEVWGGRSPWPDSLARVRDRIHQKTGEMFQVARCLYYQDGSEGVEFHSDPPAYGSTSAIASLSLGAEREFVFRSTTDAAERYAMLLAPGSLLFMGKGCQEHYEHALPPDEDCHDARLNITFRKYGWD